VSPCVSSLCVSYGVVSVRYLCCASLFLTLSLCVWSLGCRVLLSWVCVVGGLFLLCVSLCVPCVSYVSWWSVGCLGLLVVCWLFRVVGGLCVFYVFRLLFFSLCASCVCVVGGCACVFCSSYFRFSFVLLCVSPGFCVWFWVCGGLFLGGCLVGLGFGVVGFWVWGGGFVLWGGCWWCCFLGVVGVGVVLWAILLLLFLLLFFCLECGFGGCWAWCCCW